MSLWHNKGGFSLIEVVVAMVIAGIMMLVATEGVEFYQAQQVRSASIQLLSAIELTRQNALTKETRSPVPCGAAPLASCITSRGFGLRLAPTATSNYVMFEFNDLDDDNAYDGTGEELAGVSGPAFARSVTVTPPIGPLFNGVLRYDDRGLSRASTGAMGLGTYTIGHTNPKITLKRCVVVSVAAVREGAIDGTGTCV